MEFTNLIMFKKIKYITGMEEVNEIKTVIYSTKSVNTEFIKYYKGASDLVLLTNGCARYLVDYICNNVTDTHLIRNDVQARALFAEYMKKYKTTYAESSIYAAFKQLVELDILIQLRKGLYIINPVYFYKGNEQDRLECVKKILEFKNGTRDSNLKPLWNEDN